MSPAQRLSFGGVSQQAAAIGAARDSAGDPETLAAIGRLSTAAENARTEVDYQQIPAVSRGSGYRAVGSGRIRVTE